MTDYTADPFELRVDARRFRGWTSASFSASLETASRSLAVTLIGVYQDDTDEQIVTGDFVTAWAGEYQMFAGYVEQVSDSTGPDSETLTFAARSKTCDIVDSSAPVSVWNNIRLDKLADALCADLDAEVVFDDAAVASKVVRRFRTEIGETVFDALDRLAKEQGLLVTDDEAGALVLTRPASSGVSSTRLRRGVNVLASSGTWDVSDRFSVYEVKGQTVTDLDIDEAATGSADDPGVSRYRRLVISPEKNVDRPGALERARWEAVTRAGKSLRVSVTLAGWRQDDGTLWRPNQLVRVTDRRKRLLDATLLVVGVDMSLDSAGRKTTLHLAPAAGFEPYVPGSPILSGAGRWFGAVEGDTRPDYAALRRAGALNE